VGAFDFFSKKPPALPPGTTPVQYGALQQSAMITGQGAMAQQSMPSGPRVEFLVEENPYDFRVRIVATVDGDQPIGPVESRSNDTAESIAAHVVEAQSLQSAVVELILRLACSRTVDHMAVCDVLRASASGEHRLLCMLEVASATGLMTSIAAGKIERTFPRDHPDFGLPTLIQTIAATIVPRITGKPPVMNAVDTSYSPSVPPLLSISGVRDGEGYVGVTDYCRIARVDYATGASPLVRSDWEERYGAVGTTKDILFYGEPAVVLGFSPMHIAFYARLVYSAVVHDKSLPESWPMLQIVGYDAVFDACKRLADGFYMKAISPNILRHLMFSDRRWSKQWRDVLTQALDGGPVLIEPHDYRGIYVPWMSPHEDRAEYAFDWEDAPEYRMERLVRLMLDKDPGSKLIARVNRYSKFWDEATPDCTNWPAMKSNTIGD